MHTFDNMGLANQVAVPPQFLSNMVRFFFRPTPLGFRQVVFHVQLHVARKMNWLIKALTLAIEKNLKSWTGMDRYIIQTAVTSILSDMVRHIEQELKDIFAQPHWISEVTSNRDGLSATFDSVGTLIIHLFINSNWRNALRMGTALSFVVWQEMKESLTIVVNMDHDVTPSQFFSPRPHCAENCEKTHSKMIAFLFDTLIIVNFLL